MSDSFELKLNSPLTKEDWNEICDVELEHTKKITYKTPSGKEVVFIPLAELEEIKAELLSYEADCQITADTQTCMKCTADTFKSIEQILDKHIKEIEQ